MVHPADGRKLMARKRIGCCVYCRRELAGPRSRSRTAVTRDHVMPKCVGGTRKVRCCRQRNGLKGDIHPQVWRWFTEHHPGWWKTFETNSDVVTACAAQFGNMVRVAVTGRARREVFEQMGAA
jgi:hypothetical protein